MSYDPLDPIALMIDTARILARHAIEDNVTAEVLAENVIDNTEMVVFSGLSGTAFLRIVMEQFKKSAMTCPRQQVDLLIGAVKIIKPICYAKIHGED